MQKVREKLKMMSVNQINCYHTLLEAYNIKKKSASDQIKVKWSKMSDTNFKLRSETNNDIKVPIKPKTKCTGFTYQAAKLFNMLPVNIRENSNPNTFKTLTKEWIWKEIPAY